MSATPSHRPPRQPRGIPYEEAVRRGVCGAQRKDEARPCQGPRDDRGNSACGVHCGSKNRVGQGYPCSQHPRPNGRCNSHGGKSLVGPDSPQWVHGQRSKLTLVLHGTAVETFEQALDDPAYVEMRTQMALLTTMLFDATERAQVGRQSVLWEELEGAWARFNNPGPERAPEQSADALRSIGRVVREGVGAHRAQEEVKDVLERQRRMAETERRRMTEEQQSISAARALAFAGAVFTLVRETVAKHVGGTEEEREIVGDIRAGLAERVGTHVGRGSGDSYASLPGGGD